MRKIRQVGMGALCLSFILGIAICSFTSIAKGGFEVSKRRDFATDDTTFATNESIYVGIGIDQLTKLVPGNAKLKVFVIQKRKKRLKQKIPIVITADKTAVSFTEDIAPLFTENGAWHNYDNTSLSYVACFACHAGDDGVPPEECPPECHLMDLSTRAGWLAGADGGTEPLLGEDVTGVPPFNWGEAKLKKRLRNNRMPPGVPFYIDESNRNGPDVGFGDDGNDLHLECPDCACETTDCGGTPSGWYVKRDDSTGEVQFDNDSGTGLHLVGLIGAWVDNAAGGGTAEYGSDTDVTWCDIAPAFCQPAVWYDMALACTACHYCSDEPPCYHVINFCTEAGIKLGADGGAEPLLGEAVAGTPPFDWAESGLRARLRNNRMPPNAPFDLNELTRNGPQLMHPVTGAPVRALDLVGEWVGDGAPDN